MRCRKKNPCIHFTTDGQKKANFIFLYEITKEMLFKKYQIGFMCAAQIQAKQGQIDIYLCAL